MTYYALLTDDPESSVVTYALHYDKAVKDYDKKKESIYRVEIPDEIAKETSFGGTSFGDQKEALMKMDIDHFNKGFGFLYDLRYRYRLDGRCHIIAKEAQEKVKEDSAKPVDLTDFEGWIS